MNTAGKKRIIKSLAETINNWLDNDPIAAEMNVTKGMDIGYIANNIADRMAELCVTALQMNQESQDENGLE
jgi:hypothetical protein